MVESFCRAVDKFNDVVGKWGAILFIPLVLIVTYDVILRRFFNSPTIWAGDIEIQLAAFLAAFGGGYLLIENGHIIVDVIYNRFPFIARKIIELVTWLLFFLGMGVVFWSSIEEARRSIELGERMSTLFEPTLIPLRIAIAVGFFLLLLEGLAKYLREILSLRAGKQVTTFKADAGEKSKEVTG